MQQASSAAEREAWTFLRHEPCPSCGSRDNLAVYAEGHRYCWGCNYYERGEECDEPSRPFQQRKMTGDLLPVGEYRALVARGISEKICRKFGYYIATDPVHGPVQVAPYYNSDGVLIAQKLRTPSKDFAWRGDSAEAGLWGQQLWDRGGRMVVVTEGEIDCLSVAEAQEGKWPVVSIACGACKPGATAKIERYIAKHIEWLTAFETVVFLFDDDEQGKASAVAAAKLFKPGQAKIASLPLHDASDMLKAGRKAELISAIWNAREYRPDGLITVADIVDQACAPIQRGLPWPWPTLTDLTLGRFRGEIVGIGAGTGAGKSDFLAELLAEHVRQGVPISCFAFEAAPVETVQRIAGKLAGCRFHLPDDGWTPEELRKAVTELADKKLITIYDHQGADDWDEVEGHIRYLTQYSGILDHIVDPITAFTSKEDDENTFLKHMMERISSLAKQLQCTIYFVSHLTTPKVGSHEEGARVTVRDFRGSRAIGYWSNTLIGLERDQQAEDDEDRRTTTVRILKCRRNGLIVGKTMELIYEQVTGRLLEKKAGAAYAREQNYGFTSEDQGAQSLPDGDF